MRRSVLGHVLGWSCFMLSMAALPGRMLAEPGPIRSITFMEVLKRARDNPPAVRAALALFERVRAEEQYARGAYIPRLTVEGGAGIAYDNRATTPNKIDVPDSIPRDQRAAYLRSLEIPRYEATSLNNYGRVNLDYALLDSSRRHAVASARGRSEAQWEELGESQRQAQAQAAELFLQGIAAVELAADARITEQRRSEQHEAIRRLAKAGLRPTVDAVRAEVEMVAARFALETREIEQQAAFAALAAAIGEPPTHPLQPEAIADGHWPAPLDPSPASAVALKRRPEVRQLQAALAARRADHEAAIGARLPTLGIGGTGNVSHASILKGTGIQGISYAGVGSIYLRWAALDPAVWRRAEVTRSAISEAQRALDAQLLSIQAEVVEAAYAVKRTRAQLEQATQMLSAAETTRTSQNERYRAGIASLLDLLDAEALEQNARRQRIEAERDYRIARVHLLATTGSMDELTR